MNNALGFLRRAHVAAVGVTVALMLTRPAVGAEPVAEAARNVVHLSASASVEVAQDQLSITLSTTREAADAQTLQQQLKQLLDAALGEARKVAAPGLLDVRTGNFSLYPRRGRDGRITGWQGGVELILEGRDFPRISAVAGRIQTLTLGQVKFGLSREEALRAESQVRATAIERFRTKANDIARGFGFGAYTLREISVNSDDANQPQPLQRMRLAMASSESAEAPVPVEAGRSTVTVTVSGTVQLR